MKTKNNRIVFEPEQDLINQIKLRAMQLNFSIKDYLISLIEKDLKKTGVINIICEKNKTITT